MTIIAMSKFQMSLVAVKGIILIDIFGSSIAILMRMPESRLMP